MVIDEFKDKYNLSLKENIFICKKLFSSLIYCGLKMENRNITFPQTEVILKGVNVTGVALDDIYAILGLKHSFEIFFKKVEKENLTLDLIKEFNLHIARDEAIESGVIRTGRVSIAGTDYIPPILSENDIATKLDKLLNSDISATHKAIKLFLHLIRLQVFWDGNKRTALLASNFLLVKNGKGVLNIKENNMLEFAELLNDFFNTNRSENISKFLYDKCICGIEK